jgi:hypothetical protein
MAQIAIYIEFAVSQEVVYNCGGDVECQCFVKLVR